MRNRKMNISFSSSSSDFYYDTGKSYNRHHNVDKSTLTDELRNGKESKLSKNNGSKS